MSLINLTNAPGIELLKINDKELSHRLRVTPKSEEYWNPLRSAARDAGNTYALQWIEQERAATIQEAPTRDGFTTVMRDGIQAPNARVAYRSGLTLSPNSRTARNNVDHDAFGFTADFDPLADKIIRSEIAFNGEAQAWCCGTGASTVGLDFRQFQTTFANWSVGFTVDKCEWIFGQKFTLIDEVQAKTIKCNEVLETARCSIAFHGDQTQSIRGLKQMLCERVYAPKFLTEMNYWETYNWFELLVFQGTINRGERAIVPTDVLLPTNLRKIFNKRDENTSGNCCELSLGEKIRKDLNLSFLFTDWMDSAGSDGGAAMLFYQRAGGYINNLAGFTVWLPPQKNCNGDITFQKVLRRGELENTDAASCLLVEQFLPKPC
jgi:hypothetical protein